MTLLLIKLFIKNYEDTNNSVVRTAYGNLGSIVGILANLFLSTSKIMIGLLFNSMSILADGINNLSDMGSSIITLVGFKLSSKPADQDHPYGHERIEYISGLIVSFIILILGIELIKSSFSKIFKPEPLLFSSTMVVILVLSILIKIWLSHFNNTLGKRIQSTTMQATAADSRNDVLATLCVLIATLISHFTGLNLDGYMGILVGLFICYSGYSLIKETTSPLLGQAPDEQFVKDIQAKLLSYDYVCGIHDLLVHNYGPNRSFASVHIEVPDDANLLHCHDIIDNIEREFESELGIHLVIHLDPIVTSDEATNIVKSQINDLVKEIDDRLSIHDFRMVVGTTHTNLIFDITVPVGYSLTPKELAHRVDLAAKAINPIYYTIITVDTNYISTCISSY